MSNSGIVSTERLPRAMGVIAIAWIAIVLLSLAWNLWAGWATALDLARVEARVALKKDLVYRRWAAMHGGVYVPPTAQTPPNPYLRGIPGRDVVTTDGRALTLVNPAYMTRQVHELGATDYGLRAHITSLRPIRPENAPDAWETEALQKFETGAAEVSALATLEGARHLRLMHPLRTEPSCLKCHGEQGYKVGDLRGGLSASVPLAPYLTAIRSDIVMHIIGHGVLGGLGLLGLSIARRRIDAAFAAKEQATVALGASERMFRTLVAGAGDGFECLDESGRYIEVNEESCRQLGYSRDELLRMNIAEVDPRLDMARYTAVLRSLVDRPAITIETIHRRKDGTIFPVEIKASAVRDEAGLRSLALVRDVTERKRAEAALEASERQFRTIVETTTEGVWTVDQELRTRFVNRRLTEILGYTAEEMAGLSPDHFMFAEDAADHAKQVAARREGRAGEYERRYRRKDGSTVWTLSMVAPIRDETGGFGGAIAMLTDITERRRAEEELRRVNQRLALHIEHTPHAVIEFDLERRVRAWNPAAVAIFGFSREEVLGQTWQFMVPKSEWEQVEAVWDALTRQAGGRWCANQNRTKDGRVIFCEWFNTPLVDGDGQIIGIASLVMDVTERRRAEEALRVRNEELTRFNRAATGRELRMIELKREINELCQRCHEPPRYPLDFSSRPPPSSTDQAST